MLSPRAHPTPAAACTEKPLSFAPHPHPHFSSIVITLYLYDDRNRHLTRLESWNSAVGALIYRKPTVLPGPQIRHLTQLSPAPREGVCVLSRRTLTVTEVACARLPRSRVVDRIPSQSFRRTALRPTVSPLPSETPRPVRGAVLASCLLSPSRQPGPRSPHTSGQGADSPGQRRGLHTWSGGSTPRLQGSSQPAATPATPWPGTPKGLPPVSTGQRAVPHGSL